MSRRKEEVCSNCGKGCMLCFNAGRSHETSRAELADSRLAAAEGVIEATKQWAVGHDASHAAMGEGASLEKWGHPLRDAIAAYDALYGETPHEW